MKQRQNRMVCETAIDIRAAWAWTGHKHHRSNNYCGYTN